MKALDPETVVLGLGGNVGGDAAILARFAAVVRALEMWSTVRGSRVYRTAALGPAQPDFLNAAVAVDAPEDLAASELIREVQAIERSLGRDRGAEERWGPRPIDLDVLLWG
ncbi:MAG: 2-amino-4-hydroxy-6-hydroxymethyldihydropteridine diphosphokinase, partial [Deltaproteobacteria bacterium]|nr:2-amino-4-hydroxy-6-hydroxymethyldihydropteridine diphosphokinase [Kofleriaceae bacterium]